MTYRVLGLHPALVTPQLAFFFHHRPVHKHSAFSSTLRRLLGKMSKAYQPTAEQLALAEARKAKKRQDKEKAKAQVQEEDTRGNILTRDWLRVKAAPQLDQSAQTVRVMTWNVRPLLSLLATRVLFGSDGLSIAPCANTRPLVHLWWPSQRQNVTLNAYQGRELFPASDCLKASQREHMINKEIVSHNADICCLQVCPDLRDLHRRFTHAPPL